MTSADTRVPDPTLSMAIQKALTGCQVVVAIIGDDWLAADGSHSRSGVPHRLDDNEDPVRLELAAALSLGLELMPVLLDGVPLPSPTDLPDELRPLVRRHSVALSQAHFDADASRLATRIDAVLGVTPRRRRRHRKMLVGGAVGVITLMVVVAAVVLGGGGESRIVLTPGVAAAADLDTGSGALAVGADAIWVTDAQDDAILRVDPETLKIVATIPVGDTPLGVEVTSGAVWVVNRDGTVSRIDPNTDEVVAEIVVGLVGDLIATRDALWLSAETDRLADHSLRRIDLVTNEQSTVSLPGLRRPTAIDAEDDAIWMTDRFQGTLTRLDPTTGGGGQPIELEADAGRIAASGPAVWVASSNETILRIDPTRREVVDVVGAGTGSGVTDLSADDTGVWVAGGDDSIVHLELTAVTDEYMRQTVQAPDGSRSSGTDDAADIAVAAWWRGVGAHEHRPAPATRTAGRLRPSSVHGLRRLHELPQGGAPRRGPCASPITWWRPSGPTRCSSTSMPSRPGRTSPR